MISALRARRIAPLTRSGNASTTSEADQSLGVAFMKALCEPFFGEAAAARPLAVGYMG